MAVAIYSYSCVQFELCNPRMLVTVADLIIAMANDVIHAIIVALHAVGRFMGSGSLL